MLFPYFFKTFVLKSCLIIYSSLQNVNAKGNEILFLDDTKEYLTGYLTLDDNSISSSNGNDDSRTEKEKFDINLKLFPFDVNSLDEKLKFEYFSRDIPDGVQIVNQTELNQYVDTLKPMKLITHGWMSSGQKDSSISIKNGFLHKYDANVIIMDWSEIADNVLYPVPLKATSAVGKYYGQWLNYLVDNVGINPNNMHMVGHSLGAHVSGFAGREIKRGKVARITGLDPAAPGFGLGIVESGALNRDDADFVDIIHTCAGYLGYKDPIGHADFYPNGGIPPQPGCNLYQVMKACSHSISWKIFASSLKKSTPYLSVSCQTVDDATNKHCNGSQVPLGDPVPVDTRGVFYSDILVNQLLFQDVYDEE